MKQKSLSAMLFLGVLGGGFLWGDFSGLMNSAGDFFKGVGKSVEKAAGEATKSAGINLPAAEIDQRSRDALRRLYKTSPEAARLGEKAKAILVFPEVLKAGVGIGGLYGEGTLFRDGNVSGYYSITAASYGLQLGGQSYAYAMFFMDDGSLEYLLEKNQGWEVGTGPSVVLVDKGMASTMNNTTLNKSVYVFTFAQKGLMAGTGIQGSKINRIHPK